MSGLDTKKSSELLKEIDLFLSKRNRSNRKLARDVADWVDQAMQISSENKEKEKLKSDSTGADTDIIVASDCDCDD